MKRVLSITALVGMAGLLTGCSMFGGWFAERDPWRREAEARCIASGVVRPSAYIQPVREIDGAGACGADHPFKVTAVTEGRVAMSEQVLMNCPMVTSLESWVATVVQPIAMATFGQPVAVVETFGTYSCRRVNHRLRGSMSEHAYMNAIDVSGFKLADGHRITIKGAWYSGQPQEQAFLHTVGAESCKVFNTVLGPSGDASHQDHFHLDLANRSRSGRRVCRGSGPMVAQGGMSYGAGGAYDPAITGSVAPKIDTGPEDSGVIDAVQLDPEIAASIAKRPEQNWPRTLPKVEQAIPNED
ncbi:extensin family protein [Methyloraptor flagellatus]|uniref:Extensin family protein n=1 Tax=Methyloraptor flagellatus TaxID=3162530 RepID=A0AAU7XBQ9_9HYPH